MGLDIRAYCNHIPADADAADRGDANRYYKWGDEWADREIGAPDGWQTATELAHDGCSYGGYSRWRDAMALAYLGIDISRREPWPRPADTEDPLWKLIHYADNEGVFGPPMVQKVAARLAALDPSKLPTGRDREMLAGWSAVFSAAAAHADGCVEWG